MPIKVPCDKAPSHKGISLVDLKRLAEKLSFTTIPKSKRELCKRINMFHGMQADKITADFLRELGVDIEYVVQRVAYDETRRIDGKDYVQVYWLGYPEPTWEPAAKFQSRKNKLEEQKAVNVLAQLKSKREAAEILAKM